MNRMRTLLLALLACAFPLQAQVRIVPQHSGVDVRLRGISAVNDTVAWASGQQGTVLRTTDGGLHWQAMRVAGAERLDFRDVEGFDADTAVVLSIGPGESSRIYRTSNGGRNWILVLQNADPRAFFDCMAFEGERGWMLGDPVDGRFQVYATHDRGTSWRIESEGPQAADGEAAFAASGTCIARTRDATIVGSGGSTSRLHARTDAVDSWAGIDSGMSRGIASAGVFSLDALREGGIAVGGDYMRESEAGNAVFWRITGGEARIQTLPAPRGYRSGIACANDALPCIAVGPAGVDGWDDTVWSPVTDTGYDAIDLAGANGWVSGDDGRIARIETILEEETR